MIQFVPCFFIARRIMLMLLIAWLFCNQLHAGQIDIGLFESDQENRLEIMVRPDFRIEANQTITAIRYTIRWLDADISLTNHFITPYNMSPVGTPEYHNGYYYQIYLRVLTSPVGTAIEAGEERLIAAFSYPEDYCGKFELIKDEWTADNLGNPILELQGTIRTGIIYASLVDLQPKGGIATGGGQIEMGDDSGPLVVQDYEGDIAGWQRKLNVGEWEDVADTQGLTTYNEEPADFGNWHYRAVITKPYCAPVFSEPALVQVFEPGVNIVIHHTGNGLFEVRMKPHINIETGISNIQFAIRWPIESVELKDFAFDLDLEYQYTDDHEEHHYAMFVAVPDENQPLNWLAGEEYLIMSFAHDESGNDLADFIIANDQFTEDNNMTYYVEWWGQDITGLIHNRANDVFTGISRSIELYVMLEGPYDATKGLMHTTLNDLNLLPHDQPHAAEPWNYQGDEHAEVFDEDVVDWLLLEFRDASTAGEALTKNAIATKAVLLKNDGSLLNQYMEEISLKLENAIDHQMFVLIRHRNHIDILSYDPMNYDETKKSYSLDLRFDADKIFGSSAAYNLLDATRNIHGMVAGDADGDGEILPADRSIFRQSFGSAGYKPADYDFDGEVLPSDRSLFRKNFGISNPL